MSNSFQDATEDLRGSFATIKQQTEELLKNPANPSSMRFELIKLLVAVDTLLGVRSSAHTYQSAEAFPPEDKSALPDPVDTLSQPAGESHRLDSASSFVVGHHAEDGLCSKMRSAPLPNPSLDS